MVLLLGIDYYDEQQLLRDEYSHFLEEPPLHLNSILRVWWKRNVQRFPKVAMVAKYIVAQGTLLL